MLDYERVIVITEHRIGNHGVGLSRGARGSSRDPIKICFSVGLEKRLFGENALGREPRWSSCDDLRFG